MSNCLTARRVKPPASRKNGGSRWGGGGGKIWVKQAKSGTKVVGFLPFSEVWFPS